MLGGHATRTRLGLVLAVGAGVLLGAVFGQPGSGSRGHRAKPTTEEAADHLRDSRGGQTLTATRGTWTGNPTSFRFSWSRCDTSGSGVRRDRGRDREDLHRRRRRTLATRSVWR